MKLIDGSGPRTSAFPHLITQDLGRNVRWPLQVANAPVSADRRKTYSIHAEGALDAAGRITAIGRRAVVSALTQDAKASRTEFCVVWSDDACTFLMADGSAVDGRRPPQGDPIDPDDYEAANATILDVRFVKLPEGCPWQFVCIRKLDFDHVEVSAGEHLVLGHFDELPQSGPGADLRRHLDRNGKLVRPSAFRGAQTTSVSGNTTLLGPVQPNGHAVKIVPPWPQDVFAACEEIAERRLSQSLLQAAWRAVDPMEKGLTLVGSLEAA